MNPKQGAQATTGNGETGAAWLPLSEAAAIAGVSVRAMQKRAASGKIGARKIDIGAAPRWEVDARELPKVGREPDANQDANREPTGREPGANSGTFERESGREPRIIGREQDANREPTGRELSPEREAELKSEIAFLRGLIEQRDRDAAELRAVLREALRAMPKQLTASPLAAGAAARDGRNEHGTASGVPIGASARGVVASNGAPEAPQPQPTGAASGARPSPEAPRKAPTYGEIADELERDLAARGL